MKLQVIDFSDPTWLNTLEKVRYDFYHLPEYSALEARRINAVPEAILIEQDECLFFLPYLLRQCSGLDQTLTAPDIFDAVSPYGYPGVLLNAAATHNPKFLEEAMHKLIRTFQERHVCSAFLRLHPILNATFHEHYHSDSCTLHSETIAVDLTLPETEIWHQTRPEHRNKINKCKRAGFTASMVSVEHRINDFIAVYNETMDRVGASQLFYFGEDYFSCLSHAVGSRLHLCIVEFEQQVACAGLFTEFSGIVQYHFGGTRTQFLKKSPTTLMFNHVRQWAQERGNTVFHLGGGVGGAKDSLYHFKAGFSQQRYYFPVLRLITSEPEYYHLVNLRAKALDISPDRLLQTDYFPAYRSLEIDAKEG